MEKLEKLLLSGVDEDNMIGVELYLKKYGKAKLLEICLALDIEHKYWNRYWQSNTMHYHLFTMYTDKHIVIKIPTRGVTPAKYQPKFNNR